MCVRMYKTESMNGRTEKRKEEGSKGRRIKATKKELRYDVEGQIETKY